MLKTDEKHNTYYRLYVIKRSTRKPQKPYNKNFNTFTALRYDSDFSGKYKNNILDIHSYSFLYSCSYIRLHNCTVIENLEIRNCPLHSRLRLPPNYQSAPITDTDDLCTIRDYRNSAGRTTNNNTIL